MWTVWPGYLNPKKVIREGFRVGVNAHGGLSVLDQLGKTLKAIKLLVELGERFLFGFATRPMWDNRYTNADLATFA
ncbi:hypothetical protein KXX35_000532 [Aspergillus fumigatus]|nr:hypothetical protein KXX35_000532 [Aspergillus fumigatus]